MLLSSDWCKVEGCRNANEEDEVKANAETKVCIVPAPLERGEQKQGNNEHETTKILHESSV